MKYLPIIVCLVGIAHADESQRHEDAQDQVEATRGVAYEVRQQGQRGDPLTLNVNGEDCHFKILNGIDDKQKTVVTDDGKRHAVWFLECPSDSIEK